MKKILTMALGSLIFTSFAFANGETLTIREQAKGTAEIDEEYTDELVDEDVIQRQQDRNNRKGQLEKTKERMNENPRNPAFSESFEQVENENEEDLSKRKQDMRQKQEEREGEAQGRDFDDTEVWR